ncbi:Hint domain-containing protein [Palleronia sp.]|uniref:Hint domain-containing protein n=1 Tax=Palleronia sp. TaxID=1940284 RepID=UPI0035C84230
MSDATQARGTYVLPWSDIRIDGRADATPEALVAGAELSYDGQPLRIDGASDILTLTDPIGGRELRRRAGRVASRMLRKADIHAHPDIEEPGTIDAQFTLSDGVTSYGAALLGLASATRPLILFTDRPPPARTVLTVRNASAMRRRADPPRTICFAAGTTITTECGPTPIELLRVGDRVLTRDDGPQPVLWTGHREISDGRLHVMPHLRPVRIPSGAFDAEDPRGDLLLSPRHRLLVRGQAARALFNTPEVLVAASDLAGYRGIHIDRRSVGLTYVHVMLPRHQVVWANGVAAESFHPADTDLDAIPAGQYDRLLAAMPDLVRGPDSYGAPARRLLKAAEARILVHDGAGRRALRRAG